MWAFVKRHSMKFVYVILGILFFLVLRVRGTKWMKKLADIREERNRRAGDRYKETADSTREMIDALEEDARTPRHAQDNPLSPYEPLPEEAELAEVASELERLKEKMKSVPPAFIVFFFLITLTGIPVTYAQDCLSVARDAVNELGSCIQQRDTCTQNFLLTEAAYRSCRTLGLTCSRDLDHCSSDVLSLTEENRILLNELSNHHDVSQKTPTWVAAGATGAAVLVTLYALRSLETTDSTVFLAGTGALLAGTVTFLVLDW